MSDDFNDVLRRHYGASVLRRTGRHPVVEDDPEPPAAPAGGDGGARQSLPVPEQFDISTWLREAALEEIDSREGWRTQPRSVTIREGVVR